MVDEIEQFSEQEGIDLQGEGTETEEVQENTAPQGLTEAQIRQIMREERALTSQEIAKETAKAFRAMQSMTDKKAAQVKSEAMKQLEAIKSTGAQITPEMEQQYVNRFVNDFSESLQNEQPEPAQAQSQSNEYSEKVLDAAMITVNMIAEENDVVIDKAISAELTKAWEKVHDQITYREFLTNAKVLLAKPDKTPPQARIPSLAGRGGSATASAESYKSEMEKARGNKAEILKIQDKYIKAGLDVYKVKLFG